MKTPEKILLSTASLIIIAKIFRLPFSGPLIVFVLPLLGMIYLIMGWKLLDTYNTKKHYFLSTTTGLIYLIIFIGILFKLQLWPNGQDIISMGSFLGLGIGAFIFIRYYLNKKTGTDIEYYLNSIKRSIGIVGTCLVLTLIPVRTLVTFYHPDDNEYVRLFMRAYDSDNQEYWDEFAQYRDQNKK